MVNGFSTGQSYDAAVVALRKKEFVRRSHVSFPASEAGTLQATMSSLELTPRVIFFLHQLGWTLIADRGNSPWQVPRDEGCSRFNCRLNPVGRCDIPISGPPENKIRPGKSEKAIQHQATLSVA